MPWCLNNSVGVPDSPKESSTPSLKICFGQDSDKTSAIADPSPPLL